VYLAAIGMKDQHGAVASGAMPRSGRRGEPRRHAPRVHGVPSQGLDPAEPITYLSWTGDGPVMYQSYTCAGDAPDREAAIPRVAAVRKAPGSADVDLAKESGAFHRRGSADGWARTIAIGSPATGPMCPQIKSPLFGSILLSELLSSDDGTCASCRSARLPVSAAGCGYRVLPGRTGTSEQTWSKHRNRKV